MVLISLGLNVGGNGGGSKVSVTVVATRAQLSTAPVLMSMSKAAPFKFLVPPTSICEVSLLKAIAQNSSVNPCGVLLQTNPPLVFTLDIIAAEPEVMYEFPTPST